MMPRGSLCLSWQEIASNSGRCCRKSCRYLLDIWNSIWGILSHRQISVIVWRPFSRSCQYNCMTFSLKRGKVICHKVFSKALSSGVFFKGKTATCCPLLEETKRGQKDRQFLRQLVLMAKNVENCVGTETRNKKNLSQRNSDFSQKEAESQIVFHGTNKTPHGIRKG